MIPTATIYNTVRHSRIPRPRLAALAKTILRAEGFRKNVNLIFVDDKRMYELNRTYRGKKKSTDVLSFNMEDDGPLLGEIYISIPQARKNAAEFGIPPTEEILKLFCHGLLHLCGIHHPNSTKRAAMAAKEEKYLKKLLGARS